MTQAGEVPDFEIQLVVFLIAYMRIETEFLNKDSPNVL